MPLYTYRREDGTTFEHRQRFADDPLEVCPTTGQKVVRLVQAPGIIFKGSGFYVNDSKKASNANAAVSRSKDKETPAATSSESSTPAESKTETKTETAAKPAVKESAAD